MLDSMRFYGFVCVCIHAISSSKRCGGFMFMFVSSVHGIEQKHAHTYTHTLAYHRNNGRPFAMLMLMLMLKLHSQRLRLLWPPALYYTSGETHLSSRSCHRSTYILYTLTWTLASLQLPTTAIRNCEPSSRSTREHTITQCQLRWRNSSDRRTWISHGKFTTQTFRVHDTQNRELVWSV